MVAIKRHCVLYDSASAGTGEWFRLDNRYDLDTNRIIQVDLTTDDTVTLQGTTVDVRGGDPATVVAGLTAKDISTIKEYTADANGDVLTGPWTYIRVVKTGTNGNAKVQGFI